MSADALLAASRATSTTPPESDTPVSLEYVDTDGRSNLGVAARIPSLDWTVIVEQPTSEAYATATQLRRQLMAAISIALLGMIAVGFVFGRSFINPILKLKRGTQELAAGRLDARVDIRTGDEFAELGDAFNTMADRLVELQENVKRQERQAMFGRIAAGLVHDLSHPIQNIGNSARLIARDDVDPESRETFRRTVDRELVTLRRFLDDLRHLVRPKPVERFAMDVNGSIAEIVDPMRAEGERQGIAIEAHYASGAARHQRRSVRAGPRLPQPDHQRHPGHRARRERDDRDRARRRSGGDQQSRIPDREFRPSGCRRFSTTSSRPSAGGSASAWPFPSGLSSSSTAPLRSQARWAAAPLSPCGSPYATKEASRPQPASPVARTRQRDSCSRTLVKTDAIAAFDNRSFAVRYFELRTMRGARRYSAEIIIAPGDRIILDDDSVSNLEVRASCLVPATIYSRVLAARATAA